MSDATPAPVRGRPPKAAGAPHGPGAVTPAVIAAATDLFAAQGIASVSIREVARRAGVNPALVSRYIGDRDALVRAVLDDLYAKISQGLDDYLDDVRTLPAPTPNTAVDQYVRIVAHLVIEGRDLERFEPGFPLIRLIIEMIESDPTVTPAQARRRGAQIFTLELAAHLFGAPLLRAAGLEPGAGEDLTRMVRRLSLAIADGATALDPLPRPGERTGPDAADR